MGTPDPDAPPPPPNPDDTPSLFHDAEDVDEGLLTSADLNDSSPPPPPTPSAPSATSPAPPVSISPTRPPVPEELDLASDTDPDPDADAVDPAAADASLTFALRADHSHATPPPPAAQSLVWILPWVVSAIAHLCLVAGAVLVVWSVREVLRDDQVIAQVSLSDNPGATLQIQTPTPVQLPTPVTPTPPATPAPTLPIPAETVAPSFEASLPSFDQPPPPTPVFEAAPPAEAEFEAEFMGLGGNAETIIFVLEADGSIISDYPQIVGELRRSLSNLSEKQRFSVIVFDGEAAKEVPPGGLRPATPDAKARAGQWVADPANVQNMGSGDAVAALRLAFRRKPQLIYLLSQNLYNPGRGQYERQRDEVLEALADAPRDTAINTLEFNDLDPLALDESGRKVRPTLMESIAQQTGGNYRWVVTNARP